MALAPTPCRISTCENLATNAGVCQAHRVSWSGSYRKQRLPNDWNTRRIIVFRRDKNKCYLCGGIATEVDHIQPGDDHNLENLAAICQDCHRGKSAQEGSQAQAGNRIRRRH